MAAGGGYVGNGGTPQNATNLYVGDSGSWRDCKRAYVGAGGVWQEAFLHIPGTPTGLSAVVDAVYPYTAVDLSWTEDTTWDTATGYRIQYSLTSSSGPWSDAEVDWQGGETYEHTPLLDNQQYWYKVAANNYQGRSAYSTVATATTDYAPIVTAPVWETGYPKDDPTDAVSVLIQMQSVPDVPQYRVYWKENASMSGNPVANADGNFLWPGDDCTVEYDHTEATFGTGDVIYYQVRGENPDSNGPFSSEGSTTILIAAPDAPTNVAASVVGAAIRVTWTDNSSNEDNFSVDQKERLCGGSFGAWTWVVDPVANAVSYDVDSVIEGHEYIFRVRAENAGGNSAYDEMLEGEAVMYAITPGAPTWDASYPQKEAGNPTQDIDLAWDNSVTGTINDTLIYRSLVTEFTPGAGSLIDTVSSAVTTYDDDNLGGTPSAPVIDDVSTTVVSRDTIYVEWEEVQDADQYKLYRGTSSGFTPDDGTNLEYTGANLNYTDNDGGGGLSGNTSYWYKVKARIPGDTFYYKLIHVNDCGQTGSTSAEGSATLDDLYTGYDTSNELTTWPEAPLTFAANHNMVPCPTREVVLSWDNGGNNSSTFTIQHSVSSYESGMSNLTTTLAAGSTNYTHGSDGPDAGDNYYQIKFNSGGDGWSQVMCPVECPT